MSEMTTSYPDRFAQSGWVIDHDSTSTRRAYDLARDSRRVCNCLYCRNYRAARQGSHPEGFTTILSDFGIQPTMEAEVSELGPATSGSRLYSGWYLFVGQVRRDPGDKMLVIPSDAPATVDWQIFFVKGRALAFDTFGDVALVQLEFHVELPWVLSERPHEP